MLQDEYGLRKCDMEENQKKVKEHIAEWCKQTGGQEKDFDENDPNVDAALSGKIRLAKQSVEVLQLMQSLQSLSNHFVTSHNYFCSSLAKAASGIRHRHRDENSVQSRGAACELAVQVCRTLQEIAEFDYKETDDHRDFRRAQRAFDDVYAILIDTRRPPEVPVVIGFLVVKFGDFLQGSAHLHSELARRAARLHRVLVAVPMPDPARSLRGGVAAICQMR